MRTGNGNAEIIPEEVKRIAMILVFPIHSGISGLYGYHRSLFHDGEYRFSAGFPFGDGSSSRYSPGLLCSQHGDGRIIE
jgi:hypothetical protein